MANGENDMQPVNETYLMPNHPPVQVDDALMATIEQVEAHHDSCQCMACRQLTEDVRMDYLLGHPRWGAIARRFVERRFPF